MTCACEIARPCQEMCACADPVMSGACRRCATYGSPEQQRAAAEAIADSWDLLDSLLDPEKYMVLDLRGASFSAVGDAAAAPRRQP